jgi:hypothetical protein
MVQQKKARILDNIHVIFVPKHLHVRRDKAYKVEIIHIYVMFVRNLFAMRRFPKVFLYTIGKILTLVICVINHSTGGVI